MAKKLYDVVAITGEYKDTDGNMKPRFMNCGVVMQTEKGLKLKLEALPVESNGWFNLYEPRSKGENWRSQQENNRSQGGNANAPFDDGLDIPF